MAKAELPKSESPEGVSRHPPERRPLPAPALPRDSDVPAAILRAQERCPVRALKEMNGTPKSRLIRTAVVNVGSPKGRESYGDGVPAVVAGVARSGDR